ncbi:MAG: alpha/beta fold hydrolase [Nitriliruptorales bacterium]|nr:alpha/beta fold hydrolase [Nitriliruptorales bacterium]
MTTQSIAHSDDVVEVHRRLLQDRSLRDCYLDAGDGRRIHVVETGDGPPLVLLHGGGAPALFLLPLLERLQRVRAIAADRPGRGLSDPLELPRRQLRRVAVAWVDRLLDTLGLDGAALLGHSGGGLWALWYALARPDRVRQLVLLGAVPALPGASMPLPFRVFVMPGIGRLLQRIPSTSKSVVQFARLVAGEGQTIVDHPEMVDLLVAGDNDPVAAATDRAELRAIAGPHSYRPHARVRTDELRHLAMPTLLIWGDRDPFGNAAVARATAEAIPDARLELLPAGHGPWLGHPERIAELVTNFVR